MNMDMDEIVCGIIKNLIYEVYADHLNNLLLQAKVRNCLEAASQKKILFGIK